MGIADYSGQISDALQNLGLKKKEPAPAQAAESTEPAPGAAPTEGYGNIGQALLNVPFPEMVKNLGIGIADAQYQLNLVGARMAQVMAGMPAGEDGQAITIDFGTEKGLTLFELGFTPSFYQFTETVIDLKMTLSYASETISKTKSWELNTGAGYSQNMNFQQVLFGDEVASVRANVSTMSTETMAKYSVKAEGTSSMRTTLVAIPPPAVLEERIRQSLEIRRKIIDMAAEIERTGTNECDLTFTWSQSPEAPVLTYDSLELPATLSVRQEADIVFTAVVASSKGSYVMQADSITMTSGDPSTEAVLKSYISKWRFTNQVLDTDPAQITMTITITPTSELTRLLNRFN